MRLGSGCLTPRPAQRQPPRRSWPSSRNGVGGRSAPGTDVGSTGERGRCMSVLSDGGSLPLLSRLPLLFPLVGLPLLDLGAHKSKGVYIVFRLVCETERISKWKRICLVRDWHTP